jgi:hypothetical protein
VITVRLTPSEAASARLAGSRSPARSWPLAMAARSWPEICPDSGTGAVRSAAIGSSMA